MTNLINFYTKNNSAIIPARKLKKDQAGYVIMPAPLKNYSIEKALNDRAEYRRNLKLGVYVEQEKKKNSRKWLLIIPSALLTASYFLFRKK